VCGSGAVGNLRELSAQAAELRAAGKWLCCDESMHVKGKPEPRYHPPKAIKKVNPRYPADAKATGVSGAVNVRVLISEEGKVIEAEAVSGHQLLGEAAVEAAKQFVFRPAEKSGVPART